MEEEPAQETPAKAYPDPQRHGAQVIDVTIDEEMDIQQLDPKRQMSAPVSRKEPKCTKITKLTLTRAPSPEPTQKKVAKPKFFRETEPTPESHQVHQSVEDSPLQAKKTVELSPVLSPEDNFSVSLKEDVDLNLDASMQEILAEITSHNSLQSPVPVASPILLDSPDIERYINLFSPAPEDKVEVETVPESPPAVLKAGYSPLLHTAHKQVPIEVDPPLDEWEMTATPIEQDQVCQIKELIKDGAKSVCLPGDGAISTRLQDITLAAKNLLKKTKIKMTWENFCKFCPQFHAAIKHAVTKTIPCKSTETLLTDVGAPRTLGMVNGIPTAIILDGGSFNNIVTKTFMDQVGITDIAPSNTRYILADGRQVLCLGTVQGLQVQIHSVSRVVDAAVFDHCQFNILLRQQSMKEFNISTHYGTDIWSIQYGGFDIPMEISYSKDINVECPTFQQDMISESYMSAAIAKHVDTYSALSSYQADQLLKLLDRFESCVVEDMDHFC
ncbi:hypothetical protein DSO57_1001750 [Entomophthora muscae]|uniref:Uncharacterized protein n=1 Tax=Entomophthora muscae TaxID=34485 RepID=A0ACC2SLQ4_9FUNG|nr:hypothetical protein DSO57_1001750 [Entomophthora muscae]